MSTTYLVRRGKRALNREARAHLARFDAHGDIEGAWCGRSNFDFSSNVPWGLRVCKQCRNQWEKS